MIAEGGWRVDHTTMYRWVQHDAPELEKRCRPHLKGTTDSWRVDETDVKVKGGWMSLSRAVDAQGNTLEFLFSAPRDTQAAKCFFAKALGASHVVNPRVITVEKNAAYPKAVKERKAEGSLRQTCELRQSTYLTNLIEQDHRFLKRLVKPGMGLFSFETAWRTLQGDEARNMMRKGQMQGREKKDSLRLAAFIAELFGVALSTPEKKGNLPFFDCLFVFLQHSLLRTDLKRSGRMGVGNGSAKPQFLFQLPHSRFGIGSVKWYGIPQHANGVFAAGSGRR